MVFVNIQRKDRTQSGLFARLLKARSGKWEDSGRSSVAATAASLEPLPANRDLPSSQDEILLLKKVGLCTALFDFTDPTKDVEEKEMKRQALLELVDYVSTGTDKLTEPFIDACFKMIRVNISRGFPAARHDCSEGFDVEEQEPAPEPSWSHLELVYEFFVRYLNSKKTYFKLAEKYFDHSFVLSVLDAFDSNDPREREVLMEILHHIYKHYMPLRGFIRKSVGNIFYRFIYETERHNGIANLLEVLSSIIHGLALPIKEEHKMFLMRTLIPLHKPPCLALYQRQLSYCILQFLEKDFKLADIVIRGLLKYWPTTNSQKEVLFLGELKEVLQVTQPAEFQRCMIPLFKQIARCLNSLHFQVAECTVFLWYNDHIVDLIAQNRHVILPIIYSPLEENMCCHWNVAVHGLIAPVREMFQNLDEELFEKCQKKHQEDEERAKTIEDKKKKTWLSLEMLAASKQGLCT